MTLLWVGLGGFLGANARYLLGRAIIERYGAAFPWGTLAINLTGAFLIGVIAEWLLLRQDAPDSWRLFLVIGVLGGYTTFSSYALRSWPCCAAISSCAPWPICWPATCSASDFAF